MPKGRPADFDLLSQEDRERIRETSGGDDAAYKRALMKAIRDARKRREVAALAAVGDPVVPAGQFHFAGEEFDLAEYDRAHKAELRRRCQTDLFFLCKDILGRDITERTHRPVCEFFGNPDPDRPLEEQLDPIREWIWIDPRGTFKTSILNDVAVQLTICFPEIRILFLGGEKSLAQASLDTYTETFVIRGEPTRFQRLFPEFCIGTSEKYERKFIAPCRKNLKRRKESTAWSNSTDSALSGWHPDVMIPDDVPNDENHANIERISKVKHVFYLAKKLLEPVHGRMYYGGTRYNPNDLPGELLSQTSAKRRCLTRAALWARRDLPEGRRRELEKMLRDPNVPAADFQSADWELLFPERLSFEFLLAERGPGLEKFQAFGSQYLNDPIVASGLATFTLERLREASVPANTIPTKGDIFAVWDLAYSVKRGRDFTVGAIGLVDPLQRLFVPEVIRGRFVTHELVYRIVDAIRRWQPRLTGIEDSPGARWLLSDLDRMAVDLGVKLNIDWFPIDSGDKAKDGRVKSLEDLLYQKRLFFSNGITCMDDLYREFAGYGSEAHDDIPDAISHLAVRHVKRLVELAPEEYDEQLLLDERRQDLHDRVFGSGIYLPREEEPPPPFDPYALEEVMPGLNG